MTFKTSQKIIKIGSSRGTTLPAKQLDKLDISLGDEVELIVRKKTSNAPNDQTITIAKSILERYANDFKNLANR